MSDRPQNNLTQEFIIGDLDDNPDERKWYLAINGEQKGPFTYHEINSKLYTQEIDYNTLIFKHGMSDWASIGSLPYFGTRTTKKESNLLEGVLTPDDPAVDSVRHWYVYLKDKREQIGPFTLAEIENDIKQNKMSYGDYIWTEKFGSNWKKISEIEEFNRRNTSLPNSADFRIAPPVNTIEPMASEMTNRDNALLTQAVPMPTAGYVPPSEDRTRLMGQTNGGARENSSVWGSDSSASYSSSYAESPLDYNADSNNYTANGGFIKKYFHYIIIGFVVAVVLYLFLGKDKNLHIGFVKEQYNSFISKIQKVIYPNKFAEEKKIEPINAINPLQKAIVTEEQQIKLHLEKLNLIQTPVEKDRYIFKALLEIKNLDSIVSKALLEASLKYKTESIEMMYFQVKDEKDLAIFKDKMKVVKLALYNKNTQFQYFKTKTQFVQEIGDSFLKYVDVNDAFAWFKTALIFASKEEKMHIYEKLGELYSSQKKYKAAISNYKKSISLGRANDQAIKDKILSAEEAEKESYASNIEKYKRLKIKPQVVERGEAKETENKQLLPVTNSEVEKKDIVPNTEAKSDLENN